MFKRKKCPRCESKIRESYSYCPSCGVGLKKENQKDYGMLGKNDGDNLSLEPKMPPGVNLLISTLMKALDGQFKQIEKENQKRAPKKGVSISITTSTGLPPEIKVDSYGNEEEIEEIPSRHLSYDKQKKFSKLEKETPKTNIRRFSDKVICEMEVPGVKSLEDVSIIRLENSIEIKALAEDKGYQKIIPTDLPISNYKLSKGKLLIEMENQ
jgi:HSP20 family molecular chaperone IbpA